MGEDKIGYDNLMQDVLRGVVRRVLERAASAEGIPPPHQIYLQFRTDFPGVSIPARLRTQYPKEMTIVFMTHYWDLQVGAEQFEVTMSFNQVPERLVVPYRAVSLLADPTVRFALPFKVDLPEPAEDPPEGPARFERPPSRVPGALEEHAGAGTEEVEAEAQVLSLDAFRKKPPN
jgi:hypothetical protein